MFQKTLFRVRYAETDAMGVAHHANYPVWFEMGRSDLMRQLGYSYAELESQGFFLMLSDLQVRYQRAARYDQNLQLETRLSEVKSRGVSFGYRLLLDDSSHPSNSPVILASGETRHISTDRQYRPSRLPAEVLELLRGAQQDSPC